MLLPPYADDADRAAATRLRADDAFFHHFDVYAVADYAAAAAACCYAAADYAIRRRYAYDYCYYAADEPAYAILRRCRLLRFTALMIWFRCRTRRD